MMAIHNRLAVKVVDCFDWIFRRPSGLSLFKLWSNLTGFDIVKFDEAMKCAEGESTSEATLRQYGEMGVNLIRLLISPAAEMQSYLESPEGKSDLHEQWAAFNAGTLNFGQIQNCYGR